MSNLIGRALQTTVNGSIQITVADREASAEFSVSDASHGIWREDLPHVFAKFHRGLNRSAAHNQGSGLELALSKAIIEAQGGKIWVESELGKGTKFTFSLPKSTS